MSDRVTQLISELIQREGGYVNHPADRGGATNWGITQAVAKQYGYLGDMQNLPKAKAEEIYRSIYWLKPKFDDVAQVYPKVAEEMFDTGVNMGPGIAARFLQEALNMLQDAGLVEDMKIGPATLNALEAYKRKRGAEGEATLVKVLDCFQGARYRELVQRRTTQRAFVYGWFAHRIGNVK